MAAPNTAVARRDESPHEPAKITPKSIVALLDHEVARRQITPFLPPGVDYEQVKFQTYLAARKNADILKCKGESIVDAVARIVSWDLVVGETAHIVPFGDKAEAVADYKGLAELVLRSGVVRALDMQPVYEGDVFEYELGLEPKLRHVPAPAATRGTLTGAYTIFRLAHGYVRVCYLPLVDIDAIRRRYSKQWKNGDCPPWYAMKTTLRQGVKILPKNPRLAAVMRVIDDEERAEFEGGAALPMPTDADAARVRVVPPAQPKAIAAASYGDEREDDGAPLPGRNDPVHPDDPYGLEIEDGELPLDDARQPQRRTGMDADYDT